MTTIIARDQMRPGQIIQHVTRLRTRSAASSSTSAMVRASHADADTIPTDPDAELIEALREASWRIGHMGARPDPLPGLPEARDLLTELRELGWTVIRTAGGR